MGALDRWRTWNAAKLPGRAVNRWVRGWISPSLIIEVHRTACIVTHPPGGKNCALINPANEQLVGTRFTPEECWKRLYGDPVFGRWDKDYATYPFQVIDGLVTEFGGDELQRELLHTSSMDREGDVRCPVGCAVLTRDIGELRELYRAVIHAVPPFYHGNKQWEDQSIQTYHAALDCAAASGLTTIAIPLLGAGARGVDLPKPEALRVAAAALVSWQGSNDEEMMMTARFGVQDSTTAHALADALEAVMSLTAATGGRKFELQAPPLSERWRLGR